MTGSPIGEDDLQAYVDQMLVGQRKLEVEAYLAAHPDIAARIADDIRHRQLLRETLAPVAAEPIPAQLNFARLARERTLPALRWYGVVAGRAAAAALLLVSGGTGGWLLRGALAPPSAGIASLAQEAADNYTVYAADFSHPVETGDRTQLLGWGSQRLRRSVNIPNLRDAGFRFLGGRLVATPHGPALLYMFDNPNGVRLVMLTRNMSIDRNAPMSLRRKGSVGSISWARDGLGFSIVGPLAASSLETVAQSAQAQLAS